MIDIHRNSPREGGRGREVARSLPVAPPRARTGADGLRPAGQSAWVPARPDAAARWVAVPAGLGRAAAAILPPPPPAPCPPLPFSRTPGLGRGRGRQAHGPDPTPALAGDAGGRAARGRGGGAGRARPWSGGGGGGSSDRGRSSERAGGRAGPPGAADRTAQLSKSALVLGAPPPASPNPATFFFFKPPIHPLKKRGEKNSIDRRDGEREKDICTYIIFFWLLLKLAGSQRVRVRVCVRAGVCVCVNVITPGLLGLRRRHFPP